jgi:putative ABC transport system permease protein
VFARLAPGSSIDAARRELSDISQRLAEAAPATNDGWVTLPIPMTQLHGRDSRDSFRLLQAAVGVVLLIACANIANILLARGTRRRHEMALRMALGASRRNILAQLLTESVMLALAGGGVGVVLAMWGIRVARAIGGFPDVIDPTLNTRVLAFTAALSMLTGVLCGILPALRASAISPERALGEEGGRGQTGTTGGRARGVLVAVQVASAVVLGTCGALMLQTLVHRMRVDLGFDPRGVLMGSIALPADRYRDDDTRRAAADALFESLRSRAEVAAAGASTWALPTAPGGQRALTLPSGHDAALGGSVGRGVEAVTPGYFEAIGMPLRLGRGFGTADRAGSAPVAIVNDELARHLWPDRSPVGELLRLGAAGESAPIVTVVGVVGSMRRSVMHNRLARVYLPYAQYPGPQLSIVVRARGDRATAERVLAAAAGRADASLMLENLRTADDDVSQFVAPVRLMTWLLGGFGVAGLLLAALGIFGTMSYSVAQRERELAVRTALGAERRHVIGLVLGHAMTITAAGLLPGIAAAIAAARLLGSQLFGVRPGDPTTLAAVTVVLALAALVACYLPARAAAAADPMAVLRRE